MMSQEAFQPLVQPTVDLAIAVAVAPVAEICPVARTDPAYFLAAPTKLRTVKPAIACLLANLVLAGHIQCPAAG
jgi:hypothetical protein